MESKANSATRKFYKTLFVLATPIFISNMLSTTLSLVDTIMIGKLGEIPIAGVGLANRLAVFVNLVIFGISSGFSVFSSQYYGAKNYTQIRKITGLTLMIAFCSGVVLSVVFFCFPRQCIALFVSDAATIEVGAAYLKILCFSMTFGCVSFALSILCRSIRVTLLPMIVSVTALVCNTVLNYALIFGHFGFPAMGVEGAAIATVIARVVEFLFLFIALFVFSKDETFSCSYHAYFGWEKTLVARLFKTAWPVIVNELLWNIGTTLYLICVGVRGPVYVAVVQICSTVMNFMQAGFTGIGSACGVIVGNEIGRGQKQLAQEYAKKIMRLFTCVGLLTGVVLFLVTDWIIALFAVAPQTVDLLRKSLWVCAAFSVFMQLSYIYIVALFRSGGDTKFAAAVEVGSVYLIALPLIYLSVRLNLPVYWVMAAMRMEDLGKNLLCYPRYRSLKWLNTVIEE